MGWSIGYDGQWNRDIGYGVPALCDHPGCTEEINRGLSYVCAGERPYGGGGCGLFFCEKHRQHQVYSGSEFMGFGCERCAAGVDPFEAKTDLARWMAWKLADDSWQQWRDENPKEVEALRSALRR
jgi:hypothetical protein